MQNVQVEAHICVFHLNGLFKLLIHSIGHGGDNKVIGPSAEYQVIVKFALFSCRASLLTFSGSGTQRHADFYILHQVFILAEFQPETYI